MRSACATTLRSSASSHDDGTINENGGKYNGMDRYECRKAIVKDLEEQGYLVKIEPYYPQRRHLLPLPQRRRAPDLRTVVREDGAAGQGGHPRSCSDGTIKFVPERFTKTYINWMENVHDWCISRQLWWGHQIPAWYCDDCGHINVSQRGPTQAAKSAAAPICTREEDVLDTWFSSALWPFSTLGWPDQDSADLKYWYPTSRPGHGL